MSENQKINDRIRELVNAENMDPAEFEAKVQEINEAILGVWADPSKHVKTLASLPPEVFEELITNIENIKQCLNENDEDRPGFADGLPQDVIIGHLVVEGINSLFEKHAKREIKKRMGDITDAKRAAARAMKAKIAEAMKEQGIKFGEGPAGMGNLGSVIAAALAAAGAERIPADKEQLDAVEQFIRSKFGPDAKIERTEDGFDVSVPTEQAPEPFDVMKGLKDVLAGGGVEVEMKVEKREQQEAAEEKQEGDVIIAEDDHGVIILSDEAAPETTTETLN